VNFRVGRVVPHEYSPFREPRAAGSRPEPFLFGAIFCLTCLTSLTFRNRPLPGTLRNPVQITYATSLLNAGVPIHVVQRYLGHLSPAMTMHYAQTLAETHEAEFLRYRKLSADGRDLEIGARDLYDMLQLDQRTDRILPNGC
jgi:hypothetical protein